MARVNEESHSFTCYPYVYPQLDNNLNLTTNVKDIQFMKRNWNQFWFYTWHLVYLNATSENDKTYAVTTFPQETSCLLICLAILTQVNWESNKIQKAYKAVWRSL